MKTKSETTLTCPWWLLFTFDNPARKLFQDPHKILKPYIQPGNTVLDVGCGMGYFSLELARLVGAKGKVIAADLQPKMLEGLRKRAQRIDLISRIQTQLCLPDRIGISEPIDFALAFWMVHEVKMREKLLQEIYDGLKEGGKLLIVEPIIHVSKENLHSTIQLCLKTGFTEITQPKISLSRAILWLK